MKTFFISFDYDDRQVVGTLNNWLNQGLSKEYKFVYETQDLRHKGRPEVEKYLKGLIDSADAIVIAIGTNTHNHWWVEWEYNYAQNMKKKVLVFQIAGTTGGPLRLLGNITPPVLT